MACALLHSAILADDAVVCGGHSFDMGPRAARESYGHKQPLRITKPALAFAGVIVKPLRLEAVYTFNAVANL